MGDGTGVHLTQKGLISKIINVTGMQGCNPNHVPATQVALGSDPDGDPMHEIWSYSSVIGMMLYLSTNTRPDITFAVSQVARFCSAPKQSHASAVKTIVRYLAATKDQGTIMRPTGELNVDAFCDADFAGLHGREPDHSPISVRSRTGYIICLGNCPLVWKSQLQTGVTALSTLEAEYIALSQCMRVLIPLRRILLETANRLQLPNSMVSTIHATVFEDNNGALSLAVNQRITNRTKHLLIWFWHHVKTDRNPDGPVEVRGISTDRQRSDYLTKALSRILFGNNRFENQGW